MKIMTHQHPGVGSTWREAYLVGGARTPFADLNGALSLVSPIDLGIKAARATLQKTDVPPNDVGTVIAGSMAQASFDAYMIPRHIGLYAGVPEHIPAHLVQRICGTGIEVISQACDAIEHKGVKAALCVGAESMSRNPVAAYTHRGGFRMGQVEFKDFLWEALLDTSCDVTMGGTAENLAQKYQINRADVDSYAERSFDRALKARADGFFADEIAPVSSETFHSEGRKDRGIALDRKITSLAEDTHPRPTNRETLAKIRPAFGGVQTGGNSSGVVDGAAGVVVASGAYLKDSGKAPLARLHAAVAVGCPPEMMGIGPAPAIRALLERVGMTLDQIDRIEINEAFGAQVIACSRELGLDEDKLNVNGGAIAIGHPLGATGVRLTLTLARELQRSRKRYGIASACIGGGQGIAILIENVTAA
jgi:acetyl-CoA C-acetyltransferase